MKRSSSHESRVRHHRGVEQREIRRVRDDARVQQRVVGQRAVGAEPHELLGLAHRSAPGLSQPRQLRRPRGRSGARGGSTRRTRGGKRSAYGSSRSRIVGSESGSGASGIVYWCSGPSSATWNDADRLKIARPCWIATTRRVGEAAAVADAVDVEDDRDPRVAGPQEVRVQRVHVALVDRAARGDQRLRRHLAAEHPLAVLVGAQPAEQVHLELLEAPADRSARPARHPCCEATEWRRADSSEAAGHPKPSADQPKKTAAVSKRRLVDRLQLRDAVFDRDPHHVGAAQRDHLRRSRPRARRRSPRCRSGSRSPGRTRSACRRGAGDRAASSAPRSRCAARSRAAAGARRRRGARGRTRRRRPTGARIVPCDRRRALGDHDDREVGAALVPVHEAVADLVDVERRLGHEDQVGAAGQARSRWRSIPRAAPSPPRPSPGRGSRPSCAAGRSRRSRSAPRCGSRT